MDIVGTSEVAEMLGVSKQTLSNWRGRLENFPSPMAELKAGPVWKREDILEWAKGAGVQVIIRKGKSTPSSKKKGCSNCGSG